MKSGSKAKRQVLTILLCNLFLSLTVVFFSPMEVMMANIREFYFPFANVWWLQLLLALAAALVLSGVMGLLPARAGVAAAGLSLALGIAAYVQALFLNGDMVVLTGEKMTVTPEGVTLNLILWGVILLLVLLAVLLSLRKHLKTTAAVMKAVASALILMQTVGFVSSAVTTDLSPGKQEHALMTDGMFAFGGEENVVVFVMDTADGAYAREMMERWPELNDVLSGWTYYPNATSFYSRTYPSLPYMLTGVPNYMDQPVTDFLDTAFSQSGFLKGLSENGVDCRVLTSDANLVSEKADPWLANSTGFQYSSFANLNLPVLETNIMKISLFKCAPYRFKDVFRYDMPEVNTTSFYAYDDPYMYYPYTDDDFHYEMEDALSVTGKYPKAFRFYHTFGTHYGVRWDENLEEIEEDDSVEVDYPAALRGCFRNVEDMISQMKALGIYDKATIIVTADHGLSGHVHDDEPLDLQAPAPVLMMVKLPGSDLTQPLAVSEAPVCHDDLFATVERGLGVPVSGTGSGKTFADFREGEARDRYYIHTMLRHSNNGDIALREYLVRGDAEDLANWQPTGRWWDIFYTTNPLSYEAYP